MFGSKMLMMELKKRVVDVLEERLDLRVDRVNILIYSVVLEKISFLGMYF